jgi:hypothetical protein
LHLEKHINLAGQLVPFFGVAGFAGRNTILKRGFPPFGFRYDVIDREPESSSSTVSTLKSVANHHIFFTKGHPGAVNGSDQFHQPHDRRDFENSAAGTFNSLGGISDDFHFAFGQQTERSSPIHNIQEGIIGI